MAIRFLGQSGGGNNKAASASWRRKAQQASQAAMSSPLQGSVTAPNEQLKAQMGLAGLRPAITHGYGDVVRASTAEAMASFDRLQGLRRMDQQDRQNQEAMALDRDRMAQQDQQFKAGQQAEDDRTAVNAGLRRQEILRDNIDKDIQAEVERKKLEQGDQQIALEERQVAVAEGKAGMPEKLSPSEEISISKAEQDLQGQIDAIDPNGRYTYSTSKDGKPITTRIKEKEQQKILKDKRDRLIKERDRIAGLRPVAPQPEQPAQPGSQPTAGLRPQPQPAQQPAPIAMPDGSTATVGPNGKLAVDGAKQTPAAVPNNSQAPAKPAGLVPKMEAKVKELKDRSEAIRIMRQEMKDEMQRTGNYNVPFVSDDELYQTYLKRISRSKNPNTRTGIRPGVM